jgi:quinol monooxygenase YgiN
MVELLVRLTAAPGQSQKLIQALRSVMRSLEVEGACQAAHAASDADDANVVWYFEEWPGVEAFERHLRAHSFARLLSVVETAATTPFVECRFVSETRGLEYLAATRGTASTDVQD